MEKEIKAIIFDVGGVLQLSKSPPFPFKRHSSQGVHEYVSSKLNISIDQYFDSIDQIYTKAVEGKISLKEALEKLAINLNITPEKLRKIYKSAYKKTFYLNRPLLRYIKKLKKKGYKVAILSDMWHVPKEVLIPKKLSKIFNVSVVSCDVGVRKPNPKIYRIILKKLKFSPREIVFIDNQPWNLAPAKKLGIKTILFKDNSQLFKELNKLGINVPRRIFRRA